MTWVVAAVAGSSIVSGYMGAKAAKDAARIQSEAADRAAMQQREMFDISRADLAPYRERGYAALADIERMMPYLTGRVGQMRAPQAALTAAPAALTSGSLVTDPQTGRQFRFGEPTDMSLDTTQAYERAVNAAQAPTTVSDMFAPSQGAPMGDTLLSEYLDPSMAFRMKYGTQATERLGNVAGGALSGNTLRSLQEFGQGLASTEYANAFNRAQSERGNIANLLFNIAGMGQGAVNTGVQAQQALGQSLAGLTTGAGAAQAAGTVGAANAYSQALQTPMNYLQLSSLLGRNPFGPVAQTSGIPGGAPTSSGVPYTSNLA